MLRLVPDGCDGPVVGLAVGVGLALVDGPGEVVVGVTRSATRAAAA
jgi:hypothetical protein